MAAYKEVRALSVPEAAYLAGLIDGEGTVTLTRKQADDMRLALRHSVRLTPRNGKYTEALRVERCVFEGRLFGLLCGGRKKEPLQPSS